MGLHKVQSSEECCKLSSQVKFKKSKGRKEELKPKEVKEEAQAVGQMGSDCVPCLFKASEEKSSFEAMFLGSS